MRPGSRGACSGDSRARSSGGRAGCSTRSAPASSASGTTCRISAEAWEQVDRGRAARRRRPRGGVLPPRPGRGAKRRAGRARPLPGRVVVPRSARPAARAAAGAAGRRASALGRRPLRRRADPRRRRAVEVDAPGRQGSRREGEERPRRTGGSGPGCASCAGSPAPRCTRCAAPIRTGASTGSSRTSGAAARRRRSSCSPTTRTSSTAPRPSRTSGCGRGSSRRCRTAKAEVGLHGSYSAADDARRIADEKERLERLSGPVQGQRYHYLRVDPHRNLGSLEAAGFAYDSSLGFGDAVGFRAGIAHPFRPWDFERDAPHELIEVPLAAMDVTLSAERYLNLSVEQAGRAAQRAARLGGGERRRVRDPLALRAVRLGAPARVGRPLPPPDGGRARSRRSVPPGRRARGGGARVAVVTPADADLPRGCGPARLVGALPRARARGSRGARPRPRPARARARARPAARPPRRRAC